MAFPPKKDEAGKKPAPKGGPPPHESDPAQKGAGLHEALMRPSIKAGQGMDPTAAMMGGMGDISHLAPPAPPAPAAPMGEGGLPIGGNLPSSDPMMSPEMEGSGLFQALNQGLDPYASPPGGHGVLDPMGGQGMGLDQLLQLLAMSRAGLGGGAGAGQMNAMNPSGQMNDMANPGQMIGMQNPGLMM